MGYRDRDHLRAPGKERRCVAGIAPPPPMLCPCRPRLPDPSARTKPLFCRLTLSPSPPPPPVPPSACSIVRLIFVAPVAAVLEDGPPLPPPPPMLCARIPVDSEPVVN